MTSAVRWLCLSCCLAAITTQETIQTYLADRQRLLKKELSLATGGDLVLNIEEVKVNAYLMKAKEKEFAAALDGAPFPPQLHFFKAKELIEKSDVFRLIQMMPKGGVLHVHDFSMTGLDWLIKNATYMQDLYFCIMSEKESIKFEFFNVSPTTKSPDCKEMWQKVSLAREKEGATPFDQWLFSKMSMWTENPNKAYPNSTAAWRKFESCIDSQESLASNSRIFGQYLWQALTEFVQDNVQYVEIRGILPALKTPNGTMLRNYTMQQYATIFKEFASTNHNFSGAKYIFTSNRRSKKSVIESDVKLALSFQRDFPDYFAGYDLVGQEDIGYPLIHFIQELLLPSQMNRSLTYFFHAGETDWEGTSVDENLLDAILLNTSRIGHGYAITKHPVAMAMARSKGVAVEVNPISNQVLGLVADLRNHPAATLIAQDFPVVISSDDPAIWNSGPLSYDLYQAFMGVAGEKANLAILKQLAQNSIRFSAMSESEKAAAMVLWQKNWNSFLDRVLSELQSATTGRLQDWTGTK